MTYLTQLITNPVKVPQLGQMGFSVHIRIRPLVNYTMHISPTNYMLALLVQPIWSYIIVVITWTGGWHNLRIVELMLTISIRGWFILMFMNPLISKFPKKTNCYMSWGWYLYNNLVSKKVSSTLAKRDKLSWQES